MSRSKQRDRGLRNESVRESPLRKSERTRQSILDGALEFLWSHPFRELTVGELMAAAGASRPAFYQYFKDLHELLETLLGRMHHEILAVAEPWLEGEGDAAAMLRESLSGLVRVGYQRGPILRAVSDAAPSDERLERVWAEFLGTFDAAVTRRIEQHQEAGLIGAFGARPTAIALNRLNASLIIEQFGRRPRGNPNSVRESITRIWVSTLYGVEASTGAETKHARTPR